MEGTTREEKENKIDSMTNGTAEISNDKRRNNEETKTATDDTVTDDS